MAVRKNYIKDGDGRKIEIIDSIARTAIKTASDRLSKLIPRTASDIHAASDSHKHALADMTTWAAVSDVTVSSVTYKVYWLNAPTASNQVYGFAIHPTSGKIYYVYNNKGTYTVGDYSANTNTQMRTYRTATNVELPIAGVSTGTTTSAWADPTVGSYKGAYGAVPSDASKRPTINPSTGKVTFNGSVAGILSNAVTSDNSYRTIVIDGIRISSGWISVPIASGSASVAVEHKFTDGFAASPHITVSGYSKATAQTNTATPILTGVTATGFNCTMWRNGTSTSTGINPYVYWIAIGKAT